MDSQLADATSSKDFAPQADLPESRWSISDSGSSHSRDSSSPPTTIGSEKSKGKQSAYNTQVALPENGCTAPVLWTIDHGSKWSAHFRSVNLRMHGILWDAGFHRPQFGLFAAGDDPNNPRQSTQVFAILLDANDIGSWTKVNEHVLRLFQMYWGSIGIPPVRYWSRAAKQKPGQEEQSSQVTEETRHIQEDIGDGEHARPLQQSPSLGRDAEPKRLETSGLLAVSEKNLTKG